MNPLAQPEIHPDSDRLSAFAEKVLPVAERAQILAHMAGCARCREIVYLAQAAAGEDAHATQVAGVRSGPRRGWFSPVFANWRAALIPAAALATVGAVVLWVQFNPRRPGPSVARLAPPPHIEQSTPRPSIPVPTQPSPTATGPNSQKKKAAVSRPVEATQTEAVSKPVPLSGQTRASIGQGSGRAFRAHPAAAEETRSVPPAQTQPTSGIAQVQTPPRSIVPQSFPNSAPAPPPDLFASQRMPGAAQGGPMLAAPTEPQLAAAAVSSSLIGPAPQPLNGIAALRLTRHPKLPSGLIAVSSAVLLNRFIAVDSAGAVFLSQDAGKHWEPVSPQWSGKAVEVVAQPRVPYRSIAGSAAKMTITQAAASPTDETRNEPNAIVLPHPPDPASPQTNARTAVPPISPMIFRLVNDRRKAWVSTDGKSWREP